MIRRMDEEDLLAAVAIENACFPDPWSGSVLEEGIKNPWNFFWIAIEGDEAVGYAALCIVAGEGEIQRICVTPQARRRGIGGELMAAMEEFARQQGVTALTLEVREGNAAARNLYKTWGFADEAIRRDYYRNPKENAVIMWNRRI